MAVVVVVAGETVQVGGLVAELLTEQLRLTVPVNPP